MIELPASPAPRDISAALIDFGFVQRPALGARVTRIERAGSRYRAEIGFPPMAPATARVFVSRLLAAKSEGLRVAVPLMGVSQGAPGAPVVDGAGQTGKTLAIRGLTPGFAFKEGFWLTLVDDVVGEGGGDGARYLHNCRSNTVADGTGTAEITLAEALRCPFGDGATILLARPTIEGFVLGEDWQWALPFERLIELTVPIEEWG